MSRRYIGIILSLIIILVLGIVGRLFYVSSLQTGKQPVPVLVFPSSAKVTVSDVVVSKKTLYLKEGLYPYKISLDGFTEITGTLVVESGVKSSILADLTPETDEAVRWVSRNGQARSSFENASSELAILTGENQTDKYPLLENLPLQTSLFTIGYKSDTSTVEEDDIIVTISAADVYKQSAINQIENMGYNPADYNIEFIDSENPFDE